VEKIAKVIRSGADGSP